jgi:AraC family transcriptional regulator
LNVLGEHCGRGKAIWLWPAALRFTFLSDFCIVLRMAEALGIFVGRFGRVALFDATAPVLEHAHSQMHVLIKIAGNDSYYDVGGEMAHLTDQHMVLVNPWVAHSNPRKAGNPPTLLLAIYLEPLWFGDCAVSLLSGAGPPLFASTSVRVTDLTRSLASQMAGLIQDVASDDGQLEELLLQLIRHVLKSYGELRTDLPSPARSVDQRIRKAVARMRAECNRSLALDELAADVGLSRSRFYQQFRACVGVSPGVYLDTLRCELAMGLLIREDLTLAQISDQLGFSAQAHFTRFFKSKTGVAPSSFRRAIFELVEPGMLQQNTDVERKLPRP